MAKRSKLFDAFVKNANAIMRAKGIKRKDLASAVGVNPVSVSRWLHQTSEPSLYYIERICDALGAEAPDLFEIREPKKSYSLSDHVLGDVIQCDGSEFYQDMIEEEPMTFAEVLEKSGHDLSKRFTAIIIAEDIISGRVYRYGNHKQGEVELIGQTEGYA